MRALDGVGRGAEAAQGDGGVRGARGPRSRARRSGQQRSLRLELLEPGSAQAGGEELGRWAEGRRRRRRRRVGRVWRRGRRRRRRRIAPVSEHRGDRDLELGRGPGLSSAELLHERGEEVGAFIAAASVGVVKGRRGRRRRSSRAGKERSDDNLFQRGSTPTRSSMPMDVDVAHRASLCASVLTVQIL